MSAADQPDLEQTFTEAFRRYGPPAPYHDPAGRAATYYPDNPFPDIYCRFVNSTEVNAVATIYRGHELVALFHGLANFINPHVAAFLSDPTMFREIGDPDKDGPLGDPEKDAALAEVNVMRVELLRTHPALGMAPLSRCPVRSQAALKIMSCALLFVHAHEVAHIVLGHLDLLRDLFGIATYEELPLASLSAAECELRRALELQADQSAALTSLHMFRQQMLSAGPNEFADADTLWAIAVESLFALFGLAMSRRRVNALTTHPSPLARWMSVRLSVSERAEEHGIRRLQLLESGAGPMQQVLGWLRTKGLSDAHNLFDRDSPAATAEMVATWSTLTSHADALARYRAIRGHRARDHV
jgi:hypothetical protein